MGMRLCLSERTVEVGQGNCTRKDLSEVRRSFRKIFAPRPSWVGGEAVGKHGRLVYSRKFPIPQGKFILLRRGNSHKTSHCLERIFTVLSKSSLCCFKSFFSKAGISFCSFKKRFVLSTSAWFGSTPGNKIFPKAEEK